MLKDAFGILKSASTSLSKEPDEISSFLTLVGNKLRRYNDHTKNMVQQAICEVIFRADNGYYEQSYLGNYCSHAHPTYTAPMSQPSCSPVSQPAHARPLSEPTDKTPKPQVTFVAPSTICQSPEVSLRVSPGQPTPPQASPSQSQLSSCSEVSSDFYISDLI